MSPDRAWHVSPTAERANVAAEGVVPDRETGETEVWLLAREDWALVWARDSENLFVPASEGFADIWTVDLRGIDADVQEQIRGEPSVVVQGAVEPTRLALLTTL